ncbi:oxygenase MpaB family protein [Gandjariella thermophila]|uniref:ER-bound oxygenase mpaB/mpaB'/Rubber oxygenase catalytic domain-containing protein n=1 Tax=Gandjariella thermophila TaxID=1931992 RepID=A0A4D4JDG5_9PSEU|nr:oxygenase MpaB family protein [Gandjariella thermophila]GDY31923.1 hypothetical protein GTS_35560 [Gandjariella thermophila]
MGSDTGLFGPDSVTWRVHGEPVLFVGGLRALLLQALHPLAMAGVAEHSRYREDPWGRLRRTADYVGTVTFGSRADVDAAVARVRAVHRTVTGVDLVTGQPYRADDPELLRWVHCCEVDSFLTTARRIGLLDPDEADAYVAEQARAGRLVGVPDRLLPRSAADLASYFDGVRPQLRRTPAAVRGLGFLLLPPMPARVALLTPARPAWAGIAALAFALLPRWARRMYGMPGLPTTDLGATAAVFSLRTALRALPEEWRQGPHLRAARARITAGAG